MAGTLTIIANAGRSGSTYLHSQLQASLAGSAYVFHEFIPIQASKPRRHNRAYDQEDSEVARADADLAPYLSKLQALVSQRDVIETGWTCYHLLPVLRDIFGSRLRIVVLHRNPWSFAMSRSNMGNYHPRTWHDDAHEVAPDDPRSIAPHYLSVWAEMNHVEKCLYWWYVVYREVFEFLQRYPYTPHSIISSEDMFSGDGADALAELIGLSHRPGSAKVNNTNRNEVAQFLAETFPIDDEFERFERHQEINDFAERKFGYLFSLTEIASTAEKYTLPPGIMPQIRYSIDFWTWRRRISRVVSS